MKGGYKQRPPHWFQEKTGQSLSDDDNYPGSEADPWAPKERQANSPPKIRTTSSLTTCLESTDRAASNLTTGVEVEKSPYDLVYSLTAYDGTPIVIVPPDYFNVVAGSFKAGLYGLDTESDYMTGELRIIQIYTQTEVYIFPAAVLDELQDNLFIKFLRSKDRIKVGVDLDNDIFVLRRYINKNRVPGRNNHLRNRFAVNGIIDIQSIARSIGEPLLSLEKLAAKYVDDFRGNDSKLGSYNPPTDEQYIYAANDAIISLKIYQPLRSKTPSERWIKDNFPSPITAAKLPVRIPFKMLPVEQRDPTAFEEAARAILAEESDTSSPPESLDEKEQEHDNETEERGEEEEPTERPMTRTPEPEKPRQSPPKRKNKKSKKKKPSPSTDKLDEIDRIVQSINQVSAPVSPPVKTQSKERVSVSPELQRKFKERIASMKKHRTGKCSKACLEKAHAETEEILNEIESARKQLVEGNKKTEELKNAIDAKVPEPKKKFDKIGKIASSSRDKSRKFIFYDPRSKQSRSVCLREADLNNLEYSDPQTVSPDLIRATDRLINLKKAHDAGHPDADKLVKSALPENPGNGKEIFNDTLDRMISLNEQFDEEEFYEIMTKITFWMAGLGEKAQSYSDLLLFVIDIPVIRDNYQGTDAILIANIFVNMALDNSYLELEGEHSIRLVR